MTFSSQAGLDTIRAGAHIQRPPARVTQPPQSEVTAEGRRGAFDLAITACHQRANRRGITPVEAALELMRAHPDNLAAYAAAHAYLWAQEGRQP